MKKNTHIKRGLLLYVSDYPLAVEIIGKRDKLTEFKSLTRYFRHKPLIFAQK